MSSINIYYHQKNSPIELESGCLYSMKIKEQTRKLAAGCSKHCFEVADGS
ncbi:hypothetical protein [Streptococcus pseudopneumoniae]|nr:hypothetical protein [Streptococcus pseudopneumoniae]